jgi:hypothetical protein
MAIIRRFNFLPEERFDVPHARMLESSVSADFDMLAGKGLAGRKPLVLRGFTIPVTGTIGQLASTLQLSVASGLIFHYGASESGTVFAVSDTQAAEVLTGTNPNVVGSFVANTTNYVGLDLNRNPDATTVDTVEILDLSINQEVPEVVPLAITLQYKIIISTQAFSSSTNVLPIAKVVTDSNNNVVSITDARNMMFRLGSGGDSVNALNTYAWGTRAENNVVFTGGSDPFAGEDKLLNNLKSWQDAMMTSIWEVRGGEYWYAPANRDNVKLLFGQPTLVANNDNFNLSGGLISWSGLAVAYENAISGTYFNTITANTSGIAITNGQCLYVDIIRESAAALVANVINLASLGTSTIPGRRFVIAWMQNNLLFVRDKAYEVGRAFPVATTSVLGLVELAAASATSSTPLVITDGGGTITGTALTAPLIINGFNETGATHGGTALTLNGGKGGPTGLGGTALTVNGGQGGATSGTGGPSISATGGAASAGSGSDGGPGIIALPGAKDGAGHNGWPIVALGTGISFPSFATGGTDTAILAISGANGVAIKGISSGTLPAGSFSSSNASALTATTTATGVASILGTTAAAGSFGIAGTALGGTGATGAGVSGISQDTASWAGQFSQTSGGPTVGTINLAPQATPSGGGGVQNGDLWIDSTNNTFSSHFNGSTLKLYSAGSPSSSTAFSNTVGPVNVAKAWAHISGGGSPSIGVNNGYNITSVSKGGSGANTFYTVTLASAVLGGALLCSVATNTFGSPMSVTGSGPITIQATYWDGTGVHNVDTTSVGDISLVVFMQQ